MIFKQRILWQYCGNTKFYAYYIVTYYHDIQTENIDTAQSKYYELKYIDTENIDTAQSKYYELNELP